MSIGSLSKDMSVTPMKIFQLRGARSENGHHVETWRGPAAETP